MDTISLRKLSHGSTSIQCLKVWMLKPLKIHIFLLFPSFPIAICGPVFLIPCQAQEEEAQAHRRAFGQENFWRKFVKRNGKFFHHPFFKREIPGIYSPRAYI